jgi:hypothetical protein
MKTYLQGAFALVLLSVALVACPSTGGSTTPPTTPPPASPTPPSPPNLNPPTAPPLTPPTGTGNVPANLVGVWQFLIASAGDYTDTTTGTTFTMTGGYAVQLKINAAGQFTWEHFSKGVSPSCRDVSYLDQAAGVAVFANNQLTLTPSQRRLTITNCAQSGVRTLDNTPLRFSATLSDTPNQVGEPSYTLALVGDALTVKLEILQRTPPSNPDQPVQPPNFQLGTDGVDPALIGLWTPAPDSSIDFYNPQTGAFTIPAYNATDPRWLRFTADGYEMAKVWSDLPVIPSGRCTKDLIYYEKGTALFKTTETSSDGTTFDGDVRFQATDARLIVNIRGCDSDNGVTRYTLKPLVSYFQWDYRNDSQTFTIGCQYTPLSAWQFAACFTGFSVTSGWMPALSRRQ